jgi:two-component system response regulator HydG
MPPTRILFVDDEPNIRLTLPAVLQRHGFEVQVGSTVAEALNLINSANFDVLISDLNIGQPGDGFTVVSAMRRTQPFCVNLILTGYPAFETALRAIQSHVDGYLVKPANVETLVQTIERGILERSEPGPHLGRKRVGTVLRENLRFILERVLDMMRSDPEIAP